MSAYFSLGASVESRIIQSQEPKSAGEKNDEEKKAGGNLPLFSPCTLFKTRSGPHNLNSALSFLVPLCPKPHGNACYGGYEDRLRTGQLRGKRQVR